MFAIHMLMASVLACCPPSECDKDTAPAAKKRSGQSEMTAVTPKSPVLARRIKLAPGLVRLASIDDQVGDVKVLDDDDGDAFIVSAKSAGAIPAGGPWLGLQFGPPSKPLRVQLGIEEGQGQMVLNIVQGGPADTAGLVQYDIIIAIDGRSVPAELDKFIDMIRNFVPGETRTLTYIRGGKQAQATLSIGSRPEDLDASQYKYEVESEALSQNQVQNFGRILEKDKDGNWVMRDLGKLEGLPEDIWKFFPQGGGFGFSPDMTHENTVIVQKINGATIKIERKDGGDITVTRTTEENGATNTTVKTYSNEDDLKAADPEAHKMLSGSKSDLGQLGRDQRMFQRRFNFGPTDMGQFFKQHEDMARQFQQQADELRKQAESYKNKGGSAWWTTRQPKTSFELQTNGSIRVTVRDGDQELVEQFKSIDEMKNSRPELYKKYQKLQNKPAGK